MRGSVFIFACLAAFPAAADDGADLYEKGRSDYFSAKSAAASPAKRERYLRAAKELKQFLELHPDHADAPGALFNLGSIYNELAFETGDRDSAGRALHYYRELAQSAPKNPLADDALYGVAEICGKIFSDAQCREEALRKIRGGYGNGDMVRRLDPPPSPSPVSLAERGEVAGVEARQAGGAFVLSVKLSKPSAFAPKFLPAEPDKGLPGRFYVDLQNAHLPHSTKLPEIPPDAPVASIRFGQNTLETVRIVLDLVPSASVPEASAAQGDPGIVIRVGGLSKSEPAPAVAVATPRAPGKRLRIVVDAGHGGEDAGAVGRRGTLEKNVTLAIAKKLETLLSKRPEYEVFMTRTEDKTLALSDRTHFANRVGGDLFVSIHANASPKRSAAGVSTYFLDNADDGESLRVAMRENGELTAPKKAPVGETSEDYYLEVMKASMIKNFHTVQSTDLATDVQSSLVGQLRRDFKGVNNLGVRSARFFVLTGAKMPAVLVETSFISNPKEEKRLKDSAYQLKLSQAIDRGIERFFKNLPRERDHTVLYRQ